MITEGPLSIDAKKNLIKPSFNTILQSLFFQLTNNPFNFFFMTTIAFSVP
jgi:hypothetical protein